MTTADQLDAPSAAKTRSVPAAHFRNLALYAFAAFAWELVLGLVEPLFLGGPASWQLGQHLAHWSLTAAGWALAAWCLLRLSSQRYGYNPFRDRAARPPSAAAWIAMLACVAVCTAASLLASGSIHLTSHWHTFTADYGAGAWAAMVFQYLYYVAEAALIVLLISFGQKAGELWRQRPALPWGGLALAITWGAMHLLLRGPGDGAIVMALSIVFGAIYVLAGKNWRVAYPLILLAFAL